MLETLLPKRIVRPPHVALDRRTSLDMVTYDVQQRLPIPTSDCPEHAALCVLLHHAEYPRLHMAMMVPSVVLSSTAEKTLIDLDCI